MATDQLDFSLRSLVGHAWETVQKPRDGARRIIAADLTSDILWQALALVVVVSVLLGRITVMTVAQGAGPAMSPYLANPLVMGVIQGLLLVVMVYATHVIGRFFGGQGAFVDALSLVVWLQFIMVCLQVIQTGLMVLLPPLGDVMGLIGLVLFLWLFTNFVAVLHGFQSLALVFVMILISIFALTFLMSIVLSVLGIGVGGLANA